MNFKDRVKMYANLNEEGILDIEMGNTQTDKGGERAKTKTKTGVLNGVNYTIFFKGNNAYTLDELKEKDEKAYNSALQTLNKYTKSEKAKNNHNLETLDLELEWNTTTRTFEVKKQNVD